MLDAPPVTVNPRALPAHRARSGHEASVLRTGRGRQLNRELGRLPSPPIAEEISARVEAERPASGTERARQDAGSS